MKIGAFVSGTIRIILSKNCKKDMRRSKNLKFFEENVLITVLLFVTQGNIFKLSCFGG